MLFRPLGQIVGCPPVNVGHKLLGKGAEEMDMAGGDQKQYRFIAPLFSWSASLNQPEELLRPHGRMVPWLSVAHPYDWFLCCGHPKQTFWSFSMSPFNRGKHAGFPPHCIDQWSLLHHFGQAIHHITYHVRLLLHMRSICTSASMVVRFRPTNLRATAMSPLALDGDVPPLIPR